MTVDEFRQLMESHIAGFSEFWKEQQSKDSEIFPAELEDADWFDQFVAWVEQ